jgi:uncharacterized protein (TIGR02246 family)
MEVTMRNAIPTVVLSVLLGAASFPRASSAAANGPEALVQGFINAWNTHDMKALAELFTEDADFVNVAGMRWKGREHIQTMHERSHAAKFKTTMLVETNTTVRMLHPDVAVMHFKWELSGELDPHGKPAMIRHGVMQIVAIKQASGWRIVSAQNTNAMPPV